MIGFSQDLQDFTFARDRDEGPDTVHLQKNELYELVARDYFIPPCGSRGVTREYLLKVRDNRVFRITNQEMKTFEYSLEKGQTRKTAVVNNGLLVYKINQLLASRKLADLGFTPYNIPEQGWLYRMARYIDTTNLLEFFDLPLATEAFPTQASSSIIKVHWGRQVASEFLFDDQKKRSNKKLWETLRLVSEAYRVLQGSKTHLGILEHEIGEARTRITQQEASLQDLLGKATCAYASIDNPEITADLVINRQNELKPEAKDKLTKSMQM